MVNPLVKLLRPLLPVNDITTDWDDLPLFLHGKQSQPRMVSWCRWCYADVQPLTVATADLALVVQLAAEAASGMRAWTIREQLPDQGLIQALSTTPTLGFKDDVMIRVRRGDGGVVVDLRSRSRLGKGDFGANAKRILAYQTQLSALLADSMRAPSKM